MVIVPNYFLLSYNRLKKLLKRCEVVLINNLKQLEKKIFYGDYSNEQWKESDKAVKEEFAKATEKEQQEFIDSGAGNLLAQIIEYME